MNTNDLNERIKVVDFTPQQMQEHDLNGKFTQHPDANTIYSFIAYVMRESYTSIPSFELIKVISDFQICEKNTHRGWTIQLMSGSWLCTGDWFE